LEAISSTLTKNVNIETILASVGQIVKSDIFLAKVSQAIIIGFSLPIDKDIMEFAEQEKVIIKSYNLIYELIKELTEVSGLLKEKEKQEKYIKGEAKVLATFIIEKEKIAGIKVLNGKISINDQIELYRNNKSIGKAKVVSLKTRAESITNVKKNEEAGMIFYPRLDFNIGDVIKSYSI
jgi:translation initiation factor IF-2